MIIFLDVDGVLNTPRCNGGIDEVLLTELHNSLHQAFPQGDFGIVMSSSWREDMVNDFLSLTHRPDLGISFKKNFIGVTPYLCTQPGLDPGKRSLEIHRWLELTGYTSNRYIIIDDMPAWFDPQDVKSPNFILVNGNLGFNKESSENLIRKAQQLQR